MTNDIAIIGMAGRFPGAGNVRELHRNLQTGKDCVGEIPARRFCETNFPIRDERYQVMGLLDQVDRFDRKFFSISPREAQQMDPHQRLTLEVAYEALEDSGHSPAAFSGVDLAVIVADADYSYRDRIAEFEPSMYSGNAPFSIAGRLARFFNTTGPAFILDTGCSSGLMGLSLACDQLLLGKASMALVAGARVVIDSLPIVPEVDLGVTSADGKTRSFNAGSNGSGSSEAVVAILLKPLAQARRDRDHVYAVVKSTAVNASAQSSASLTATSSTAQAALLEKAWSRAGIDPLTVGYIEAHGSGTKLGDPIEINGIDQAFRRFTTRRHFCAVSSIKSNIGHTDKVAGLCGLVKAALALKHHELFPSLHFDRPNPLIDFEHSATFINTTYRSWPCVNGAPRRAGVSSFGFAGNNVHVVLEEFVDEPPAPASASDHSEAAAATPPAVIVTLSSKRPDGIAAHLAAVLDHLEREPGTRLADVSFTLNTGREHFRHRTAFMARDLPDLIAQIRQAASRTDEAPVADSAIEAVLVFSDEIAPPLELLARLQGRFPVFANAHAACVAALGGHAETDSFRCFAFQYSLFQLFTQLGLPTENVIGTGRGDLAVRAVLAESTLAEAVAAVREAPAEADDLESRLRSLLGRRDGAARMIFVEMGSAGSLSSELLRQQARSRDDTFTVLTLDPATDDPVLALMVRLYVLGCPIDWTVFQQHAGGRRISLPGYQFERIRCWYGPPHPLEAYENWHRQVYGGENVPRPAAAATTVRAPVSESRESVVDASWSDTEQKVARIWMEVLHLDSVGLDDDFFALGGHSLFGSMVRNRIERAFGLTLEFKDIFAQSRIRTLALSVDQRLASGAPRITKSAILRVAPAAHYAVSPAQFRLWLLDQKEGAMRHAYNVTIVLRVQGPLDADRLAETLQQLVMRHEILRTHFIEVGGEPRQVVNATVAFAVQRHSANEDALPVLIDDFVRPFDLGRPPLVRAAIVHLGEASHALLLDLHHNLFDGSSYGLLLRDLGLLYNRQPLPAVDLTYKDYAAWRAASLGDAAMREAETYWLQRFRRPPAVVELPTDFPRPPARSFAGGMREAKIGSAPLARLRALAQEENATLFMALLAAYSILLAKYSGQDDVVVGSSVAGRTQAELEPIVGLFVNTVAFRTAPRDELTFRAFLAAVREDCFQVYRHQDYPFESLLQKLDHRPDRSRNPLFDTMLVLQNMDLGSAPLAEGLHVIPGEFVRRSAKFDLTLEFYEANGGLHFNLEYCAALFKPATVDRIAADLIAVLEAAAQNPALRLGDFALAQDPNPARSEADDFSFATL